MTHVWFDPRPESFVGSVRLPVWFGVCLHTSVHENHEVDSLYQPRRIGWREVEGVYDLSQLLRSVPPCPIRTVKGQVGAMRGLFAHLISDHENVLVSMLGVVVDLFE